MKGLVSDRNRSSSSSSSDSDAAPGPKRERSLSVGSKEILAYRREQEMRQQRELDGIQAMIKTACLIYVYLVNFSYASY